MSELSYMKENLRAIGSRIEDARARVGYPTVRLVAAVKYTDAAHIRYLAETLGVKTLGENRVQQLLEHYEALSDVEGLSWHFIGRLQTNKVKYIIDKVDMIHSLDSTRLAAEIQRQAEKRGVTMDVLVEVNSGEEAEKGGILPDELEAFCLSLTDFPNLILRGFMTMAPKCEKNEEYRKYFQRTSRQCLDIWQKKLHNIGRPILSMGMSGSFEVAIEEGADLIRVGRALFAQTETNNT